MPSPISPRASVHSSPRCSRSWALISPAIAASLPSIDLIDQVGDLAEAALIQVEDGSPLLYFVYFRRDNRGRWLIQEM